jgi:hypothetical protein
MAAERPLDPATIGPAHSRIDLPGPVLLFLAVVAGYRYFPITKDAGVLLLDCCTP